MGVGGVLEERQSRALGGSGQPLFSNGDESILISTVQMTDYQVSFYVL